MNRIKKRWDEYKLVFYVMKHPFDGFYSMKYEKKGRMWVAILNFLLMWISYSFNNQYSSVIVNQSYPMSYNSLVDGGTLLMMLLLWSVANWSVTSLTDGEGKFKEIVMANCYAMTPIILVFIPSSLLSNVMAEGEGAFYFLLIGVSVTFFLLLAYVGMLTVHNYTAGRALLTIFLTLVALVLIAFVVSLFFTLFQQLYTFIQSIYMEIAFRY